jgi:hypothetical protein
VQENKNNINPDLIQPRIKWALKDRQMADSVDQFQSSNGTIV